MSSMNTSALARAYELVEEGDPEGARAILEPILAEEPNNTDAWWIYAHAIEEPEIARGALQNVLDQDPTYPGAAELLAELDSQFPALAPSSSEIDAFPAPTTLPDRPPSLPDSTPRATPPVRVAPVQPERRGGLSWLWIALVALVVVFGIILLLNVLQPAPQPTADTRTSTAESIALLPTITISISDAGAQIATEEATASVVVESTRSVGGDATLIPLSAETDEAAATDDASSSTDESSATSTAVTGRVITLAISPIPAVTDAAETDATPEAEETESSATLFETPAPSEVTEVLEPTATEAVEIAEETQAVVLPDAMPDMSQTSESGGGDATESPETPPEVSEEAAIEVSPTREVFATLPPSAFVTPPTLDATEALTPEVDAVDITDEATAQLLPSGTGYEALETALVQDLILADAGIEEIETRLGNTLVVYVCTTPGLEERADVTRAMNIIAQETANFEQDVEAVGVQLIFCAGGNTPQLFIAAQTADAIAYDADDLSDEAFQARWESL